VQSGILNALLSYRKFQDFSIILFVYFRGLKLKQKKEVEKEKIEKKKWTDWTEPARPPPAPGTHGCAAAPEEPVHRAPHRQGWWCHGER
jgi:hypothetical protein